MESRFLPSHIRALCEAYHLRPSKQYGQHYLISDKPIRAMLNAAALTKADTVVEVGPGFGVLTLPLAADAGRVIAYEIEQKLKPYWEQHMAAHPNISVRWGNVLHTFEPPDSPYCVVANLPYQITSQVIRLFLEAAPQPTQVIVMVQKEVAERMCARPGKMSLLSLSVQYYGSAAVICQVPKGAFWPPPKVDSAVVQIKEIGPGRTDTAALFRLAHAGFSSKRKQLAKNLSASLELDIADVQQALAERGLPGTARAQELSVDDWVALTQHVYGT